MTAKKISSEMQSVVLLAGIINSVASNKKIPADARFSTVAAMFSKVIEFSIGQKKYDTYLEKHAEELPKLWESFDLFMTEKNYVASKPEREKATKSKSSGNRVKRRLVKAQRSAKE